MKPLKGIVTFEVYIAGQTPHSIIAISNLKKFCKTHLQNRYMIKVIDLLSHPELSRKREIIAVPTIIKVYPPPIQHTIGDFSNVEHLFTDIIENSTK